MGLRIAESVQKQGVSRRFTSFHARSPCLDGSPTAFPGRRAERLGRGGRVEAQQAAHRVPQQPERLAASAEAAQEPPEGLGRLGRGAQAPGHGGRRLSDP